MGNAALNLVAKKGNDKLKSTYETCNEIPVTTIEGNAIDTLKTLMGEKKLYLIVNTASK